MISDVSDVSVESFMNKVCDLHIKAQKIFSLKLFQTLSLSITLCLSFSFHYR